MNRTTTALFAAMTGLAILACVLWAVGVFDASVDVDPTPDRGSRDANGRPLKGDATKTGREPVRKKDKKEPWHKNYDTLVLATVPAPRDRSAKAFGRITAGKDRGVPSTITFLQGPNQGYVVQCKGDGTFKTKALHPGLSIVSIAGPGGLTCVRELRLWHRRDMEHNLDFGMHGIVQGTITDENDAPIPNVKVTLDGAESRTDLSGTFTLSQQLSEPPLLLLRKPGFVPYRRSVRKKPVKIQMKRGCTVQVQLSAFTTSVGNEPAHLYLFPSEAGPRGGLGAQAAYPWHELSGIEMMPGTTRTFTDLPRGGITVVVAHARGNARPAKIRTTFDNIAMVRLDLMPRAIVSGRLLRSGKPVPGAELLVVTHNQFYDTLDLIDDDRKRFKAYPLRIHPNARQKVKTDQQGRFSFGKTRRQQYLTVGERGSARTFAVPRREKTFEIELTKFR